MIYFTIKKLNEKKAFFVMLCFLLAFGCKSEDKGNGDRGGDESSNGNGDATKYTLTIDKPTNGAITSEPDGIDCGSKGKACKAEFDKGTQVTLTAMADTDYAPAAWQGACDKTEADQPCQLSMDADKDAGKAFTITQYTLSITLPTNGTITSEPDGIDCGSKGKVCKAGFDKGIQVTLTATADYPSYVLGDWEGACDKTVTGQPCKLTMDTNMAAGLTFIDPNDVDFGRLLDTDDVDDDNDGLIDIYNLDMLNHIQYNLAGTAYQAGSSATASTVGAPTSPTANCKTDDDGDGVYLCGYELMRDLDFANETSYADRTVNSAWRPLDVDNNVVNADNAVNAGFKGIKNGFGKDDFASIFEGNGYTISNLYSRHTANTVAKIGLFKSIEVNATIRNLGIENANLYGDSSSDQYIGVLVGRSRGKILACHATTGTANGGAGEDLVGGLVGYNKGTISASYVTGGGANGNASGDFVGGLVGQNGGSIIASYTTGDADGGDGDTDSAGGLVGWNNGSIIASYATGDADGGNGDGDSAGGLMGWNDGNISASYATGDADGGDGDSDSAGGLVGWNGVGNIIASYATGDADGGDGGDDGVGSLVGYYDAGSVTASYAFGSKDGEETTGNDGTVHPSGATDNVDALTALGGGANTDVDASWDNAGQKTLNAWDFGTNSQPPALKYADYDGAGASSVDYCALFPAKIPGTDTDLECGVSLLPNQPGR